MKMAVENKEIAEAVQRYLSTFSTGDMETFAKIEAAVVGFGFRTIGWRSRTRDLGVEAFVERAKKNRENFEVYHAEMEELNTSAEGNIGLAWGFWVERFKVKGRPPEEARVRFSFVFKKEADGWRMFMYHRDIQLFDKEGRYRTEFTKV
jgi:ketosteroid isomerase-like protein